MSRQLDGVSGLIAALRSHGAQLTVASNVLGCLHNMMLACSANARLFRLHEGAQAVEATLAQHLRAPDLQETGKLVLQLGAKTKASSIFCIPFSMG